MDNSELRISLSDLALDLRWSWNHVADELWKQIDPGLWDLTQMRGWFCKRYRGPNSRRLWATQSFGKN